MSTKAVVFSFLAAASAVAVFLFLRGNTPDLGVPIEELVPQNSTFIKLPDGIAGPEAFALTADSKTLLTGTLSGTIIAVDIATGTTKNWSQTGGRPLGMDFDDDGNLWVCDAYRGLLVFSHGSTVPSLAVSQADGKRIVFCNGVAVDSRSRLVYFTDSSSIHEVHHAHREVLHGGATGRLLAFDIDTKSTAVIATGLRFPNGVALSRDRLWLIVAETSIPDIKHMSLLGLGETLKPFHSVPKLRTLPDNIRISPRGSYWLAGSTKSDSPVVKLIGKLPACVREFIAENLPQLVIEKAARHRGIVEEIGADGQILRVLEDSTGTFSMPSEVIEIDGSLFVGSFRDAVILKRPLH